MSFQYMNYKSIYIDGVIALLYSTSSSQPL